MFPTSCRVLRELSRGLPWVYICVVVSPRRNIGAGGRGAMKRACFWERLGKYFHGNPTGENGKSGLPRNCLGGTLGKRYSPGSGNVSHICRGTLAGCFPARLFMRTALDFCGDTRGEGGGGALKRAMYFGQ